jgi:hypothetical protein
METLLNSGEERALRIAELQEIMQEVGTKIHLNILEKAA